MTRQHRTRTTRRGGSPWAPAPDVPALERAERQRMELEAQLWNTRMMR